MRLATATASVALRLAGNSIAIAADSSTRTDSAKRTPYDSLAANRAFSASMLLAMARSDMSVACLQA